VKLLLAYFVLIFFAYFFISPSRLQRCKRKI